MGWKKKNKQGSQVSEKKFLTFFEKNYILQSLTKTIFN